MRPSQSGESALLLLDVIDVLNAEQVQYAVIGAFAASVHGAVRASMDADVVLNSGLALAKKLETVFADAGYTVAVTRGDFEDPISALLAVNDRFGNKVDVLLGLRGLEPQAFTRLVEVPFQGSTLKFIGREDFIAMKLFAGGPIDIQDAKRAIAAAKGAFDLAAVRRLASLYGSDTRALLESVLGG